jgi:N-acetylglucosamine malate deacetylase 1
LKNILVVSPHPDDETLGCGGTLLKHSSDGDHLHWINITSIQKRYGFSEESIQKRKKQIEKVNEKYCFVSFHSLDFPTTRLDTIPAGELINEISSVFNKVLPEIIYLPFRGDIHSDHKYVFDAVAACTKWFRNPSIMRVLAYETPSETNFHINTDSSGFHPNVFVNIQDYLEKKIEILKIYDDEIGEFPFPRSEKSLRALAAFHGTTSGFEAAEAFMLLKERVE